MEKFVENADQYRNSAHEMRENEIFVGNVNVREGISIPSYLIGKLHSARLGEQAYCIEGFPIEREYCRPLFINRSEEMAYDRLMIARMKK